MSKYIDASLFVEMQIYDEEYEEWSIWNGTIEDLLNQWTEQGCPPAIETSEDCISRADLIESFLTDNECKREEAKACMCSLDLMLELIEDAPSAIPTERTGEWIEDGYYDYPYYVCSNCGQECGVQSNGVEIEPLCTKYCPNCGVKMKGGTENE